MYIKTEEMWWFHKNNAWIIHVLSTWWHLERKYARYKLKNTQMQRNMILGAHWGPYRTTEHSQTGSMDELEQDHTNTKRTPKRSMFTVNIAKRQHCERLAKPNPATDVRVFPRDESTLYRYSLIISRSKLQSGSSRRFAASLHAQWHYNTIKRKPWQKRDPPKLD